MKDKKEQLQKLIIKFFKKPEYYVKKCPNCGTKVVFERRRKYYR